MSLSVASVEALDAIACPECGGRLILTREKILFCQPCFLGYPLQGEVPDLRPAHAISFRKKPGGQQRGMTALFTVLLGQDRHQTFDVKLGHCIIVGRSNLAMAVDEELTVVAPLERGARAKLDSETKKLIEKFLPQKAWPGSGLDSHAEENLGGFIRDADFLIDDKSVSRAHAVIYQDEQGVWLIDLVSKNGTFVNGFEVERIKLKNNDLVSLGTASLRVGFIL